MLNTFSVMNATSKTKNTLRNNQVWALSVGWWGTGGQPAVNRPRGLACPIGPPLPRGGKQAAHVNMYLVYLM